MLERSVSSPGTANHGRRPWWARLARLLGVVLGVLAVVALAGAGWELMAEAGDARAYPPPGRLVDVGGHRLHVVCAGSGSPTVVIEAGLGDWSTAWSLVQPEVAKTTTTCAYDRAGSGWSDPGPGPRIASQFAGELHTLLQRADVPGPYVLVGHSMGGLTMQLFARDHASEVAGLVLIESMNAVGTTGPAAEVHTPANLPLLLRLPIRGVGTVGIARVLTMLGDPLGAAPPELSRDAAAASVARGVRADHLQAFVDEFRGIAEGLAQAAEVRTLGSLPVSVLSAGKEHPDAGWPARQADLLRLSSNSSLAISEASGHNVHLDRPADATAAIVAMVERVR